MLKHPLFILLSILAITSLACSVSLNLPKANTGSTETLEISETAPDSKPAELTLSMGGGQLNISGGAEKLVEGSVEYNVKEWKPTITRDSHEVRIEQHIEKGFSLNNGTSKTINKWNLKLGDTPTNLTVEAGAYEGKLDLSAIPLTRLKISDGASKADVSFNVPNPERMVSFSYETGASNINLKGLANANFDEMSFKGGAGNYALDFGGKLQRDAKVYVDGGLGNYRLVIPASTAVRIQLSGGLNNVSTEGTWTVQNNVYSNNASGPLLRIELNVGVGNLTLVSE